MDTAFCTLKMTTHASVGLRVRSSERDENMGCCKTSAWRHLDFLAEVDARRELMHGASPQYIDLYSDKSDHLFSAQQRVGWVHLPAIASVIFGIPPFALKSIFFSSHVRRSRKLHTTEMGLLLSMLSSVPTASAAMASLASSSSRISTSKKAEKPPTSCASAIALCNLPLDTAARDAMLASGCLLSVVILWVPT